MSLRGCQPEQCHENYEERSGSFFWKNLVQNTKCKDRIKRTEKKWILDCYAISSFLIWLGLMDRKRGEDSSKNGSIRTDALCTTDKPRPLSSARDTLVEGFVRLNFAANHPFHSGVTFKSRGDLEVGTSAGTDRRTISVVLARTEII